MNIFIVAGDVSGDMHAASLARTIKAIHPDTVVGALGGKELKKSADVFYHDLTKLSAFGFWQPVKQYFRLKGILAEIGKAWDENPPGKVILVDYYGFNLHVAREAKRRGIPVYYYVSPQVWASRPGRVDKLADCVKKMLVILPFEEEIYRKAGIDVLFVGHPLLDRIPERERAEKKDGNIRIGLFPGSRPNVFRRHAGLLERTADRIKQRLPGAEFVFFLTENVAGMYAGRHKTVVDGEYRERGGLDLAITTSGTVSLENALMEIPMVVYYRLSWFNYLVAKLIANVRFITMVNIILGRELVPELIQAMAVPEKIADEATALLNDKNRIAEAVEGFRKVKKLLGGPGAGVRAAAAIMEDRT
ncbi:MAG: lipid-A-disaccharide synthase [Endomicrobiales bacterium]|nr:lipid-A-disaccharide synthase [Endomicrobiales bacterium]